MLARPHSACATAILARSLMHVNKRINIEQYHVYEALGQQTVLHRVNNMTTPSPDMRVFAARLATFETTHHLSKRRASAQSKAKKAGTVEWPHKRPAPEDVRCKSIDQIGSHADNRYSSRVPASSTDPLMIPKTTCNASFAR